MADSVTTTGEAKSDDGKDGKLARDPFDRPDSTRSRIRFWVTGPVISRDKDGTPQDWLWKANVNLVYWTTKLPSEEWHSRAARTLYLKKTSEDVPIHLPGAMLVRVRLNQVDVKIQDEVAELHFNYPNGQTVPELKTEIELIVQTNRSDWQDVDSNDAQLVSAQCIAGEFNIPKPLTSKHAWTKQFREILTVDVDPQLTCCASGLLFDATANLPWTTTPIPKCRYAVEVAFPPATQSRSTLVVFPDRELPAAREFPAAFSAYRSAFSELESSLNQVAVEKSFRRLDWSQLELTDVEKFPRFHWRQQDPEKLKFDFRFDPGQWCLQLTDQPTGVKEIPPRGALFINPDVTIPYPKTPLKSVLVKIGNPRPTNGVPPPQTTATYKVTRRQKLEKGVDPWEEIWEFKDLQLEYRVIETAEILRDLYGLSAPRPTPPDSDINSADLLSGAIPVGPLSSVIFPQALWAFMPLADGWAQLPFLNATSQLYVDCLPQPKQDSRPVVENALFHGAVSIGNDRSDTFRADRGEVPWNITINDADNFVGTWKLEINAKQHLDLTEVALNLEGPDVYAEGLVWLAKHAPSASDALPTFDNFVDPCFMLPMRTHDRQNLYPSPFVFRWGSLTLSANHPVKTAPVTALLSNGEFTYEANLTTWPFTASLAEPKRSIFEHLLAAKSSKFQAEVFWNSGSDTALAWRRHRFAPFVQTLPMTQSAVPPNSPCASRQLIPFEFLLETKGAAPARWWLPKENTWLFSLDSAAQWPSAPDRPKMEPATFWKAITGLSLASLGLPGITFAPQGIPGESFLKGDAQNAGLPSTVRIQYQHCLPYLDEVHALAALPRDDREKVSAAVVEEPPVQPPTALNRSDFPRHFRNLAELAFLSQASGDPALSMAADKIVVEGIAEPLKWPLKTKPEQKPQLTLQYPGSLILDPKLQLSGEITDAAKFKFDALTGIEGNFARIPDAAGSYLELDPGAENPFQLVGGSMQAFLNKAAKSIRDQRGLSRGSTALTKLSLLRTSVEFESGPDKSRVYDLSTLTAPYELSVPGSHTWQFWFRDLPIASSTLLFRRAATSQSTERRGANNPEALSRDAAYLNGYEWRLGLSKSLDDAAVACLPFGPFLFFPLSLERVELAAADGPVSQVEITGRLQLPLPGAQQEQVEWHNAVKVSFVNGKFEKVEILGNESDGPLDDQGSPSKPSPLQWPLGSDAFAPVLFVSNLKAKPDKKSFVLQLQLVYSSHGVNWSLPSTQVEIPFAPDAAVKSTYDSKIPGWYPENSEVALQSVELILAPAESPPRHEVIANWRFRWDPPTKDSQRLRLQLSLQMPEMVYPKPDVDLPNVIAEFVHPSESLKLDVQRPSSSTDILALLDQGTVQVVWTRLTKSEKPIELLPGVKLRPQDKTDDPSAVPSATSGFAMLAFDILGVSDKMPELRASGGAFDAIFHCRWGTSLENPQSLQDLEGKIVEEAVFQPSSGILDVEYVCRRRLPDPPDPSKPFEYEAELLLNGIVEIRNLISWPLAMLPGDSDPGMNTVKLPAVRQEAKPESFSHLRHVARILFSQHKIPRKNLMVANGKNVIFDISNESDSGIWTACATVEHQLFAVPTDTDGAVVLKELGKPDYRFTTVQEVRLCSPRSLYLALKRYAVYKTSAKAPRSPRSGFPQESSEFLLDLFPNANSGDFAAGILHLLTDQPSGAGSSNLELLQDKAVIVDASVSPFVRGMGVNGTDRALSGFSVLPSGTMHGVATFETDFQRPDVLPDNGRAWALLQLPFLGRLYTSPPEEDLNLAFHGDPVQQLREARKNGTEPPTWALSFGHWRDRAAQILPLAEFDLVFHRLFKRLDLASLRESWVRLHRAATVPEFAADSESARGDQPLEAAMATILGDGPGELGRADLMTRVYDPRRTQLPPGTSETPLSPLPAAQGLVWQPDSLWILQTDRPSRSENPIARYFLQYGFLGAGAILLQAIRTKILHQESLESWPAVHSAATLIPADRQLLLSVPKDAPKLLNEQPQSLALSPYLRLGFRLTPASGKFEALVQVAEMIALDVQRQRTVVATSKVWTQNQIPARQELQDWAAETHDRLAADSPAAVLRKRTVSRQIDNTAVLVKYEFELVKQTQVRPLPVDRVVPVRSQPQLQRSREAVYGGVRLPKELEQWELAPPLVDGVQPIRLAARPEPEKPEAIPGPWPWGLSGLRLSVTYREADAGMLGPMLTDKPTASERIWWQGLFHVVQYRLPSEDPSEPKRILLPTNFRADARAADWPSWPSLKLPQRHEFEQILGKQGWQSVLEGRLHLFLMGYRPGVPYLLRPNLQTQSYATGIGEQSGGIPVQHRMPRPVIMPRNKADRPEIALQTIPGPFDVDANQTLGAVLQPRDNAYIAARTSKGTVAVKNESGKEYAVKTGDLLTARKDQLQIVFRVLQAIRIPNGDTKPVSLTAINPGENGNITSAEWTFDNLESKVTVSLTSNFGGGRDQPGLGLEVQAVALPLKPTKDSLKSMPTILLKHYEDAVALKFAIVGRLRKSLGDKPQPDGDEANSKEVAKWFNENSITLTDNLRAFRFTAPVHDKDVQELITTFDSASEKASEFREWLLSRSHGQLVWLVMNVGLDSTSPLSINNYRETLRLPFRIVRQGDVTRVPFQPRFITFEDPEYNRRLVSSTAYRSKAIADGAVEYKLTLAADRRQYNPTGIINFLYYVDGSMPEGTEITLRFKRVTKSGVPIDGNTFDKPKPGTLPEMSKRRLEAMEFGSNKSRLEVGDVLRLVLLRKVKGEDVTELEVDLQIVRDPVIPTPQAAYALLRRFGADPKDAQVECVRFAWGPEATRIELIDADDLRREIVRRRAIFHWCDSPRQQPAPPPDQQPVPYQYAVQKINTFGSTHFPI